MHNVNRPGSSHLLHPGKTKYVATCHIKKHKVAQTGQSFEGSGQFVSTPLQSTGGFPNG